MHVAVWMPISFPPCRSAESADRSHGDRSNSHIPSCSAAFFHVPFISLLSGLIFSFASSLIQRQGEKYIHHCYHILHHDCVYHHIHLCLASRQLNCYLTVIVVGQSVTDCIPHSVRNNFRHLWCQVLSHFVCAAAFSVLVQIIERIHDRDLCGRESMPM